MFDEIFEDLYFARYQPWEECTKPTPEMQEASAAMDEKYRRLESVLDADGKKLLGDLLSDRAFLESLTLVQAYKGGFRFGVKLMVSTLYEKGESPSQANPKAEKAAEPQ